MPRTLCPRVGNKLPTLRCWGGFVRINAGVRGLLCAARPTLSGNRRKKFSRPFKRLQSYSQNLWITLCITCPSAVHFPARATFDTLCLKKRLVFPIQNNRLKIHQEYQAVFTRH